VEPVAQKEEKVTKSVEQKQEKSIVSKKSSKSDYAKRAAKLTALID